MRKISSIFIACVVGALAFACAKSEPVREPLSENEVPICFARNISMSPVLGTKAEISSVDGLYGVLALDASRTIDPSDFASVLFYNEILESNTGEVGFKDGKAICYPSIASNYTFYAYRTSESGDPASGKFASNAFLVPVTFGENDILWAKSVAPVLKDPDGIEPDMNGFNKSYAIAAREWYPDDDNYLPSFTFQHLTTELTFSIEAESKEAEESLDSSLYFTEIRLSGLPTKGKLDVLNGQIIDPEQPYDVSFEKEAYPTAEGVKIGEIFTVPELQSFKLGYSFTFEGTQYDVDNIIVSTPSEGYLPGHRYSYKIVVRSKDDVALALGSVVVGPEPVYPD